MRLVNGSSVLTVICAFAPQVGCDEEEKEDCWKRLDLLVMNIPEDESIIIGADLNGHVGEGSDDSDVIGKWGVGVRNSEGDRIVEYAMAFGLKIVNTCFEKRRSLLITYKSGPMETQIDFIYCVKRRTSRKFVTVR